MQTLEKTREQQPTPDQDQLASQVFDIEELQLFAMHLVDQWDAPEFTPLQNEREFNARTSIMERLTASGHLSSVKFEGDMDEIFDRLFKRLLNAVATQTVGWEKNRNFYELVEAVQAVELFKKVSAGTIDPATKILTFSDFPEECPIDDSHDYGYRSLNMKGMVRTIGFERSEDGWKMEIKQVSRSNTLGSVSDLARQSLTTKDLVDVVRNLDLETGSIFGDDPSSEEALLHPSYENLEQISTERENRIEQSIAELSEYEKYLDTLMHGGVIDYQEKLGFYRKKEDAIIHKTCLLEPSYARSAMGEKSAVIIEQAALHMAAGNHQLGRRLFHQARHVVDKRASVGCGGNGKDKPPDDAPNFEESQNLYDEAEESGEGWGFDKWGKCRVNACPSKPNNTWLGPCDVCEDCQRQFDKGKDPSKWKPKKEREFKAILPTFVEEVEDEFSTAA